MSTQLIFKQITALAFLPPGAIPDGFDELRSKHAGQLEPLFEYISLYYVHGPQEPRKRKPTFPPEIWSVYEDVKQNNPRTNNILEGWHNKWRGVVKQGNPPFYNVVRQFQLEERTASAEICRSLQAEPAPKRSRKQVDKDRKLLTLVNNYDPQNTSDFVLGIALALTNKY